MRHILAFLLLLNLPLLGEGDPEVHALDYETESEDVVIKRVAGTGLLLAEFVAFPALDWHLNRHRSMKLQNPFDHIEENEPYMQDELWHFVGASATTSLNHALLSVFFDTENPIVAAGVLSLLNWTIMECLDGMAGSGFSLRDQAGNALGAGFGMLSLAYPALPVHIRVGVKSWPDLLEAAKSTSGSKNVSSIVSERYTFMQVEIIYMHKTSAYGGVAVSTTDNGKDVYGITAGFDILKWLNGKKDGWWNGSFDYFSDHFTTVIGFTFWVD